tara:strand:- start:178 stop:522 length:345 start_codon:yes stop_codon:yes gene_type:complete
MKLSQLKSIVKDAVKEAIQEEMKDILLEAIKVPKTTIQEKQVQKSMPQSDKAQLRENMMSVLDGMRPGADGTLNANTSNTPLAVSGFGDTTSPNGKLPEGNVSMDQIMGLMNKR